MNSDEIGAPETRPPGQHAEESERDFAQKGEQLPGVVQVVVNTVADTRQPSLGFTAASGPLAFRHRLRQMNQPLDALGQTVVNNLHAPGLERFRQAQNPGDEQAVPGSDCR